MIKKIIHVSDIHVRTFQYHDLYEKQFKEFQNHLSNLLKNDDEVLSPSEVRIVITGDIFHQKINISNEQMIMVSGLLQKLATLGRVIIIPGNHDFLENNTDRIDSITPVVELLNNPNIIYYKDSGVYEDENINWVVYSLYQHNQKPEFEKTNENQYIGLFHGPVQGFSTNLGYKFDDGYDKLNFHGCDAVLCGDIHKRAIDYLENEITIQDSELKPYIENRWEIKSKYGKSVTIVKKIPIVQIGSFLQNNFGESVKHHGYGVYNVESREYKFVDLPNDQPFLHFSISDINDIENERETLLNLE